MAIRCASKNGGVRIIANGDLSLALETHGVGRRNVLFVHGWISSRRMFYDVARLLDPAAFTAHLLDLRGAGLSDRTAEGHDLPGYASDVRTALASIDGPVDLVAHSMGGKVAQYVALEPPPNLARLVLLAPGSAKGAPQNDGHRAMAERTFGSRTRIERFQRAAMVRDIPPASVQRIVEDALVAQREAWFGWYDGGRNASFFDRVREIALPTVVVAGERDPLAPPAKMRRNVADAIPGAIFISLRDAGHNLAVETPAEIAGIIERLPATDS